MDYTPAYPSTSQHAGFAWLPTGHALVVTHDDGVYWLAGRAGRPGGEDGEVGWGEVRECDVESGGGQV